MQNRSWHMFHVAHSWQLGAKWSYAEGNGVQHADGSCSGKDFCKLGINAAGAWYGFVLVGAWFYLLEASLESFFGFSEEIRVTTHSPLTAQKGDACGHFWVVLSSLFLFFPFSFFAAWPFLQLHSVHTKGHEKKQPTVWAVWQGWHLKQSPFQLTIKTNGDRAIGRLQDLESPSKNFLVMISLSWLLMLKNLCADSWGF